MAKLTINIGTPNGKDGDPIRDAFNKVNQNFTELYTLTGGTAADLSELAQDYAAEMFTNGVHNNVAVTYDDAENALNLDVTTAAATSDTPPTSPIDGEFWWDSTSGRLKVYYDDGDSQQWVDASPLYNGPSFSAVNQHILPTDDSTYDLGAPDKQWRSLYVSGSTIYIGGAAVSVNESGSLLVDGTPVSDAGTVAWANVTDKPTFAAIATSGSYSDLSNPPTIPADIGELTDTGNLLFDGNYASLSNKPTIPTLGNFTLSNNNITASSGADPIVLSIFGADAADPPALISRQWSFNTNGSITFPDTTVQTTAYTGPQNPFNQFLNTTDSASFANLGLTGTVLDGYASITINADRNFYINLDDSSTGQKTFQFGRNGSLTFPDATVQTTAWTGIYTATTADDWNGTAPTTIASAIDRLAAAVKALNGTGA